MLVPCIDVEWPYEGLALNDCYILTPDQLTQPRPPVRS